MSRIALWTFDASPGSTTAVDSETSDGVAQDGTFENGATTTGSGSGVFDGVNDYVEVPTDAGFNLDTGSVVISFTQDTASTFSIPNSTNAAQTLFSRDSSGFDGGGHLTIYILPDGTVAVRHQDDATSYNFQGGTVTLGQPTTITYSWSPTGSQLVVDGVVVDTGTDALTLAGNSEPILIGVSQASSGDGIANNLGGFFDGTIEGVAIHDEVVEADTIPCLTMGTLLLTPNGEIPVEHLCVGDLVCTLNNGPQPIRWLGSRIVALENPVNAQNKLRPVRIRAGALGDGLPKRDLLVSRQHRMLISSIISVRMFGRPNVLSAAVMLTTLPGINIDHDIRSVTYFHLMFDQHEVIFAEHAPTESLYAGTEALQAISPKARWEILTLFPELSVGNYRPPTAFPIPPGRLQKQLVARHLKNKKPLLENFSKETWVNSARRGQMSEPFTNTQAETLSSPSL